MSEFIRTFAADFALIKRPFNLSMENLPQIVVGIIGWIVGFFLLGWLMDNWRKY